MAHWRDFTQLVITIETARELERQLHNFISAHDYGEVPYFIRAAAKE